MNSMWHRPARHLLITSATMVAGLFLGLFFVTYATVEVRWREQIAARMLQRAFNSDRLKSLQEI